MDKKLIIIDFWWISAEKVNDTWLMHMASMRLCKYNIKCPVQGNVKVGVDSWKIDMIWVHLALFEIYDLTNMLWSLWMLPYGRIGSLREIDFSESDNLCSQTLPHESWFIVWIFFSCPPNSLPLGQTCQKHFTWLKNKVQHFTNLHSFDTATPTSSLSPYQIHITHNDCWIWLSL